MPDSYVPKQISVEAIPGALQKAERYRLLNDPEPAESICLDILAIDEGNQTALAILLLSLSDQLLEGRGSGTARKARGYLPAISDEYERAYFAGLIDERQGRALLRGDMTGSFAYGSFRDAMDHYERADTLKSPGNDEAILRWNCCVRTINQNNLRPRQETDEVPLE